MNFSKSSDGKKNEDGYYAYHSIIGKEGFISKLFESDFPVKIREYNLSSITFYKFQEEKEGESWEKKRKKTNLVTWECQRTCKENGSSCNFETFPDNPNLCSFQAMENDYNICPYVTNVMRISQLSRPEFRRLQMDLNYRLRFGRFAQWITNNYDVLNTCNEIPVELFKELKKYPEFSIANIVISDPFKKAKTDTSNLSLDFFKAKIEEDHNYTGFRNLTFLDNVPFNRYWENTLLNMYIKELEQYRDGLLMRCFNSPEENEYLKWKERNVVRVFKIKDTFVIFEPNLMEHDRTNDLPDFIHTRTKDNQYFVGINFEEKDIDKAIQLFSTYSIFFNRFVARMILEILQEYKATGKLPVYDGINHIL